jgi:hypothetical protein
MRRLRALSRLTTAGLLVLGCSPGQRGTVSSAPSSIALPPTWIPPACLIADTSTPTPDTLRLMMDHEARTYLSPRAGIACDDRRGRRMNAAIVVTLRASPGGDLRDALELGAGGQRPDVLVTREPAVLAYARRRAEYLVEPLPWSATYVFAVARHTPAPILPQLAEREALARDAVATAARGAAEPFAWLADSACAASSHGRMAGPTTRSGSRPVVAYAAGDPTARQLAERVVSLAGTADAPVWLVGALGAINRSSVPQAVAVPSDSIPAALADGRAAAAVFAVPRDPRTRCGTRGDMTVHSGAIPLVDARAHAIVRRGSGAAFLVAPDGALQFVRQAPR